MSIILAALAVVKGDQAAVTAACKKVQDATACGNDLACKWDTKAATPACGTNTCGAASTDSNSCTTAGDLCAAWDSSKSVCKLKTQDEACTGTTTASGGCAKVNATFADEGRNYNCVDGKSPACRVLKACTDGSNNTAETCKQVKLGDKAVCNWATTCDPLEDNETTCNIAQSEGNCTTMTSVMKYSCEWKDNACKNKNTPTSDPASSSNPASPSSSNPASSAEPGASSTSASMPSMVMAATATALIGLF